MKTLRNIRVVLFQVVCCVALAVPLHAAAQQKNGAHLESNQRSPREGKKAFGNDQLDEGLRRRGLVGALPKPGAPKGNKEGVVVIRVRVRDDGTVSSASYHPIGSSTSDEELVRLAISAARRTRFIESSAAANGGVITYRFVLK